MTRAGFLNGLTVEEEVKVKELQDAVAHVVQGSPALQSFCTRSCYVRYLRARSWNVPKATKMLQETLKWRASYHPEQIRWEDVAEEARSGKMFVMEHPDREGRPVVLMRPRNENSQNNETRLKYLVYTLEQASCLADDWAEDGKMAWLVDFVGYSRKNAPPIKMSLDTLHILQNHYPERLGKAVSYQPPLIFDLLWRAVSPFIDPVTHKKLVFLNKKAAAAGHLGEHFVLEHIDQTMGGSLPLERVFDLSRLEERYRLADAAADRQLLAATAGAQPAAQQAQGQAQHGEVGGAAVAVGGEVGGDCSGEGMPSPGASMSSLAEEASGSLAAEGGGASLRGSVEGEEHQGKGEDRVGSVAAAVQALRVA